MLNSCYLLVAADQGSASINILKQKVNKYIKKLVEEGDLILFDTEVMTWNCVRGGDDHVWLTQFDDN